MSNDNKQQRPKPRSGRARAFDDFTISAFLAVVIVAMIFGYLWVVGQFPFKLG